MKEEIIEGNKVKDNMAAFCPKCKRIVFASATDRTPSDELWNAGFSFAMVTTDEVHENYGCTCPKNLND